MRDREPLFEPINYERAAIDAGKKTQVSLPKSTDDAVLQVNEVHADREDNDFELEDDSGTKFKP